MTKRNNLGRETVKPELKKAVYGGVAGTVVLTMIALVVAPMMTGEPMDIAALLGTMVGGLTMGWVVHLVMGIVIFPLVYANIVYSYLSGSGLKRGLILGVALWLAAVIIVMPMAGTGFMMANIGGLMAVMASLVGHLLYGGLLGAIAGDGSDA